MATTTPVVIVPAGANNVVTVSTVVLQPALTQPSTTILSATEDDLGVFVVGQGGSFNIELGALPSDVGTITGISVSHTLKSNGWTNDAHSMSLRFYTNDGVTPLTATSTIRSSVGASLALATGTQPYTPLSGSATSWAGAMLAFTTTSTANMGADGGTWIIDKIVVTITYTPTAPTLSQTAVGAYEAGPSASAAVLASDGAGGFNLVSPFKASGYYPFLARFRIQEAGTGSSVEDYQIQFQRSTNGGSTWSGWGDVATAGGALHSWASPDQTEGGLITAARLGAGSGTWVNGRESEDGIINSLSVNTNTYTEVVYAIRLEGQFSSTSNKHQFRIRRVSGGVITYSQILTVNSIDTPAPPGPSVPVKLKSGGVFTNRPVLLKAGGVFTSRPTKTKVGGVFR